MKKFWQVIKNLVTLIALVLALSAGYRFCTQTYAGEQFVETVVIFCDRCGDLVTSSELYQKVVGSQLYQLFFPSEEVEEEVEEEPEADQELEIEVEVVEANSEGEYEVVLVESISTDCYCYKQLGTEAQQVYDQVLDCILRHTESVNLATLDPDIIEEVYYCVTADHGNLFWVYGFQYYVYSRDDEVINIEFVPTYTMTYQERLSYQAQVDQVVAEWLSGISDDASDYEKSLYVFDLLYDEVEYDLDSENNQNILSVFLGRSSVCQGLACAYQYLLAKLGVQSTVLFGQAGGDYHAWNLVFLDGEYYMTDCTWGKTKVNWSDGRVTYEKDYSFFNATSDYILQTHDLIMYVDIPWCTATANAYRN